jgi:hypothetical protein
MKGSNNDLIIEKILIFYWSPEKFWKMQILPSNWTAILSQTIMIITIMYNVIYMNLVQNIVENNSIIKMFKINRTFLLLFPRFIIILIKLLNSKCCA